MITKPEIQEIEKLLKEIRNFVANGEYIFRGEAQEYEKVSSKTYREIKKYMNPEDVDIQVVQERMLKTVKKYTKEQDGNIILEELQHLGGSTNQIDFTTDYLIALFFACDGNPTNDGKLIFLDKGKLKGQIHEPRYPQNRVIAQKSIFVRSHSGLVESDKTIKIDMEFKKIVLRYLSQHHNINAQTIYNDIHGYITRSEIHEIAHGNLYRGIISESQGDKKAAIGHYEKALEDDPIFEEAHNNIGVIYSRAGNYDAAIVRFNKAVAINPHYADAYFNLGLAKTMLPDFIGAIEDFQEALRLAKQQGNEDLAADAQKEIANIPAASDS